MTHQTRSSSSSDVPHPSDPLPVHFLLHQRTFMVITTHTDMLWQVHDLDKATLFRIMVKILVKFYQQCVCPRISQDVSTLTASLQ